MVELYKYYFILFLTDLSDNFIFISNTDPVTYTSDVRLSKLYENEVNVDNDILENYERFKALANSGSINNAYKAKIKKDNYNNIEIIWKENIL